VTTVGLIAYLESMKYLHALIQYPSIKVVSKSFQTSKDSVISHV